MNEEKRSQLACLLMEIGISEINNEINRFLSKKDKENALRLCKVNRAIDTILEYLEK